MKRIFKDESWNELLISCSLIAVTYAILIGQISTYNKKFNYKWQEKYLFEDPSFKVYSSYKIKRKSLFKSYYLEIYKGDQLFYRDECALSLESYCKSLLEGEGLPIKNLRYKEGVNPYDQKIFYLVRSFEIINNGEIKKIDYSSVEVTPKKQNNIIFIICASLLCLAVHIWVIRKWILTKERDFDESRQWSYWLLKIGLPVSVILACAFFIQEVNLMI